MRVRHAELEALAADDNLDLDVRVLASDFADEIGKHHRLLRVLAEAWQWTVDVERGRLTAGDGTWMDLDDEFADLLAVVLGREQWTVEP